MTKKAKTKLQNVERTDADRRAAIDEAILAIIEAGDAEPSAAELERRELGLRDLVKLGELMTQQEATYLRLKAEMEVAKAAWQRTQLDLLPVAMEEIGVGSFRLIDGAEIALENDVSASITEANRAAAHKWLIDNEFGGLIKCGVTLEFDRGEVETAEAAFAALGEKYEEALLSLNQNIHPQTLKAFVKEQLAEGRAVPVDLFSVHRFTKAVVKKGK